MSSKARITSEFATAKDIASRLQIPRDRVEALRRQMYDLKITDRDGNVTIVEVKRSARDSTSASTSNKSVSRRVISPAKKK